MTNEPSPAAMRAANAIVGVPSAETMAASSHDVLISDDNARILNRSRVLIAQIIDREFGPVVEALLDVAERACEMPYGDKCSSIETRVELKHRCPPCKARQALSALEAR